jgi:hypothetical protein
MLTVSKIFIIIYSGNFNLESDNSNTITVKLIRYIMIHF